MRLALPDVPKANRTPDAVPSELFDYVGKPEPGYRWTLIGQTRSSQLTTYEIQLVSQTWQGIRWTHTLIIHEPAKQTHPNHVLLFVTGGSVGRRPGKREQEQSAQLALLASARVATLYQVPNQPLLGGRKEDDLITETWLRYLKTGDPEWPLLFPMVKSAVKAMDAIEEFSQTHSKDHVDGFVVTGASKRGWTTWLSAVADRRVLAIAPIVIDTLNFRLQMQHQLDTWGEFSEQIVDYTSKGLVKTGAETDREARLRRMMDPFTYRRQLTRPKLLIIGTNDRYWVLDALNNYWNDLAGPKSVLYVPNAGHGLDGQTELAMTSLAAFFQHVASKKPLPKLRWEPSETPDSYRLAIQSQPAAQSAHLWVTQSESMDFRNARWTARPLEGTDGHFVARVAKPNAGHIAFFGQVQFSFGRLLYSLSTQVRRE